jgi:hypothetical protein
VRLAHEVPALRARLSKLGVHLTGGDGYLQRILASSRDERIPVADCHPGERFLFINEESIVSPCHFTTDGYGVPLKDLSTDLTSRGLPQRFAAARANRRLAACEDCHCTWIFEKFAA